MDNAYGEGSRNKFKVIPLDTQNKPLSLDLDSPIRLRRHPATPFVFRSQIPQEESDEEESSSSSEEDVVATRNIKVNGGRNMTRISKPIHSQIEDQSKLGGDYNDDYVSGDEISKVDDDKCENNNNNKKQRQFDEYKGPITRNKIIHPKEFNVETKKEESESIKCDAGDNPAMINPDTALDEEPVEVPIQETLSFLTISKIDCSDFYKDFRSGNKREEVRQNKIEEPDDTVCAQLDRKWSQIEKRIRDWMIKKPLIKPLSEPEPISEKKKNESKNEKAEAFNKLEKTVAEKYNVKVMTAKSNQSNFYHADSEGSTSANEDIDKRGKPGQNFGTCNEQKDKDKELPNIPPSYLNQFHETMQSLCPLNGMPRKTQSESKSQLPSNFSDVSFHYKSDDGDIHKLSPTGFSINFSFPKELGTNYSQGMSSSYFPGNKPVNGSKSYSSGENMRGIPMPEFIVELNGANTKSTTNGHLSSALSMIPMVHSEANLSNVNQSRGSESINASARKEYNFNGVQFEGGRRRPGSISKPKKRSTPGEISGIGWKIRDFLDKQDKVDNGEHFVKNAPFHIPLSMSSLGRPQNASKFKRLPVKRSQNTWSPLQEINFPKKTAAMRNNNKIKKGCYYDSSTSDREMTPINRNSSQSPPIDEENEMWKSWKKAAMEKPHKKVTKAIVQHSKTFTKENYFTNRICSRSSSQTDSKNFIIQGNIISKPKKSRPTMQTGDQPQSTTLSSSFQTAAASDSIKKLTLNETAEVTPKAKPKPKSKPKSNVNSKGKKKVGAKTKTKHDTSEADPYYMLASASERELINELVKADMDAILERDANVHKGKYPVHHKEQPEVHEADTKSSTHSRIGTATSSIKPHGTHWAYKSRAHETASTPLPGPGRLPHDYGYLSEANRKGTSPQRGQAALRKKQPAAGGIATKKPASLRTSVTGSGSNKTSSKIKK